MVSLTYLVTVYSKALLTLMQRKLEKTISMWKKCLQTGTQLHVRNRDVQKNLQNEVYTDYRFSKYRCLGWQLGTLHQESCPASLLGAPQIRVAVNNIVNSASSAESPHLAILLSNFAH
jgi:hypothetical protein